MGCRHERTRTKDERTRKDEVHGRRYEVVVSDEGVMLDRRSLTVDYKLRLHRANKGGTVTTTKGTDDGGQDESETDEAITTYKEQETGSFRSLFMCYVLEEMGETREGRYRDEGRGTSGGGQGQGYSTGNAGRGVISRRARV